MKSNQPRLDAVQKILEMSTERYFPDAPNPAPENFGINVFGRRRMKASLQPGTFSKVEQCLDQGLPFDASVADEVAAAMREWAVSRGATHFAHVFFPLTGFSAEKHEGFLNPEADGSALSEFSGKCLIQGAPDASSFPNGGLRATHEARGYTAWDITSPAYLMENPTGATLCIPSSFVSWTGDSLDKKTPILKSMNALDKQARRVLAHFGYSEVDRVVSTAGPEQEYFLVDKQFFHARPDLMATNRTLFGAPSAKGQEFDDHYFGAIPDRVVEFMHDAENELYKLGIPVKTRHNEVAPGQFEIAPIFESANVAADHQQLTMTTLRRVADGHGFACLFHEKPFSGLNGSGKHLNWSLGNTKQGNLLDPGKTPHENAQFLVFAAAVIRGVDQYAPLLRAVIASAGNDHRLGANEAPPAIMSIFLGEQLTDVFDQIKEGGAKSSKDGGLLRIGVDTLPDLSRDAGDSNRSSPFAFTGNRFEFRAVGAGQSIAGPLVALNTIMAESLDEIATALDAAGGSQGAPKVIADILETHGKIIFNGDSSSSKWHREAEVERRLPNLKTAADALPSLINSDVVSLFEKYGVLSEAELESRESVYSEQYCAHVNVEANIALEMARTQILPAAYRYQGELAKIGVNVRNLGKNFEDTVLDKVVELTSALVKRISDLERVLEDNTEEPSYTSTKILPSLLELRDTVDQLEQHVADDLWPLPTYQEMLFVR